MNKIDRPVTKIQRFKLITNLTFVTAGDNQGQYCWNTFTRVIKNSPSPPGSMLKHDFWVTGYWKGSTLPSGVGGVIQVEERLSAFRQRQPYLKSVNLVETGMY
tara:strand:+ start:311 stop:619 length:309 start_codon:yes stop_codon:yes gene_type:complete